MVDRAVKVVLATVVLMGGTAGALLFRQSPERSGRLPPTTAPPLVLRERGAPNPAETPSPGMPTVHIDSLPGSQPAEDSFGRRPPTVLAPLDPGAPPPIMAKSYPGSSETTTSRWGTSMALGASDGADTDRRTRTHKIVDGDTLEKLAERYLGSADRAMEIYEANRYVLPGPDVLPIGIELHIPPWSKKPEGSSGSASRGTLVPVRPNASRRRSRISGRP